jgi:hypothetical protein
MGAARCLFCEMADIDTPATADVPGLLCYEHWSFFRERARKEERERAPVIVGGPLTSEQALMLAAGQQLASLVS